MVDRILPSPMGLNAEFYEFCARGELRLQRCAKCATWRHPPRHRCAVCGALEATWEPASRRGRVYSWTVTHDAIDPAFEPPYAVVVVETDDGPRLVGGLRGIDPGELRIDMPITVELERVSDTIGLLWFRPAQP